MDRQHFARRYGAISSHLRKVDLKLFPLMYLESFCANFSAAKYNSQN